jgi:hypothetical protein
VAVAEPVLIALHLALLLQPGVQETLAGADHDNERQLVTMMEDVLAQRGSADPSADHLLLRTLLMGAVYAVVSPYKPVPVEIARAQVLRHLDLSNKSPL